MTNPMRLVVAGLLAVVCIGGFAAMFANKSSVQDHLSRTYASADTAAVPGATPGSRTFKSTATPLSTAASIAKAWKPAERLDQPNGTFLRYGSGIVGVLPAPDGGSYVTYDSSNAGYTRWFPYVGGWWGTTSGAGETFRGGGPGAGK